MKYLFYAGALLASVLTVGHVVSSMKKKDSVAEGVNYDDNPGDDIIMQLIASSRTPSVFAKRYVNMVIKEKGIEARADGYYMSVLYNWGLLSDAEFRYEASQCFDIGNYEQSINEKFGEDIYTSVLVLIINELGTHFDSGTYHCYDSLEDAVTWERLIPYLETSMLDACDADNFPTFVKVFNLLFSLYAQTDFSYFTKKSEELNRIIHTDDVDSVSDTDKKMYTFLSGNIDKVEDVLSTINSKYASK